MQPVDGCSGLEGKRKAIRDGAPLANFCVLNNLNP